MKGVCGMWHGDYLIIIVGICGLGNITLAGAKELETNPTAAKTAIWTETWHPSWPIDDGGSLGGRGGGSRGGKGGGSRGGRGPSYGFGLESSGKGGNSKSVPRPKGCGCVGSTNNIVMATMCFEPFDRTTAGPISFYPFWKAGDYESCGNNSEMLISPEVVWPIRNSVASKPAEYAQYDATPEAYASTSRKSPFKASTSSKVLKASTNSIPSKAQTLNANGYASVGHEVDIVE